MGMHGKMVRDMFSNDQFGNNMFYSQRGTRNKKGPTLSSWEQCERNSEQNSAK